MQDQAARGLRRLGRALAAATVLAFSATLAHAAPGASTTHELFGDVRGMHRWITETGDHGNRPFALVDKKNARIHVFHRDGRLAGSSVALIGATPGDHIVPGVGLRAQRGEVRPDERTTPAGRFDTLPGTNLTGEHVVWVDYPSAFAIHRLRPGKAEAVRKARMETPSTADNRVSLGCVIVPVAFYTNVVQRIIGAGRAVVYVMPETRPVSELFAGN